MIGFKNRSFIFSYSKATVLKASKNSRYLQISTFAILKNLRYSILITTQKGESEAMGLSFLLL